MSKRPQTELSRLTRFTHFRALDGKQLTKAFSIGPDGSIQKTSHARPSSCIAWERSLESIYALPAFLDELEPTDAIATGLFDAPKVRVTPQGSEIKAEGCNPVRNRTTKQMLQPVPGLVMFDHDPSPLMPDHMKCSTPSELMHRIVEAVPLLKNVHWVGRGSSSQGVFNEKTGEPYSSSGGIHVYIAAAASDLNVLKDCLEVALWRAELGYVELAKNGRRLRRTIIDLSVLSPERLIFEANPILGAGVKRVAPSWEDNYE